VVRARGLGSLQVDAFVFDKQAKITRLYSSKRPTAAGTPIVPRSNSAKNHETKLYFLSHRIVEARNQYSTHTNKTARNKYAINTIHAYPLIHNLIFA